MSNYDGLKSLNILLSLFFLNTITRSPIVVIYIFLISNFIKATTAAKHFYSYRKRINMETTRDLFEAISKGLSQEGRLLKLDTTLGKDVLLPHRLVAQDRLGRG